jgi:transposase
MIQLAAQVRILVAVEPADFRSGIDGMVALCRQRMGADPYAGTVFIFRNRRRTSIRLLHYDGQGFWICTKRLSSGKFRYWPESTGVTSALQAHELQVLLWAGDPASTRAAPMWRKLEGCTALQT